MNWKRLVFGVLGLAFLGLAGFGGWVFTLPGTSALASAEPIPARETEAILAALSRDGRERPLVAIVGINDATETTDYLVPYGILRRADVADVVLLATQPGPVTLFPALRVAPDVTTTEFDARHPEGADYVIVPAMSRDDDPVVLAWISGQAAKGATVVGICAGAKVVGAAGLLKGRRATTHWYYLDALRERNPSMTYVPDRRLVVDGGVATTTGITASIPAMLTLIESIAGRERAEAVASDLGLAGWDARHDSGAFRLTRRFASTVLGNVAAFWNRERLGIELAQGIDEVSLALTADAWSRTYRSRAVTLAGTTQPVKTVSGVRILPDAVAGDWRGQRLPSPGTAGTPIQTLDTTLAAIADRYGRRTAEVVAMQLEYPQRIARD
jgi:transcriptional regulator GlxA family with amidase domain